MSYLEISHLILWALVIVLTIKVIRLHQQAGRITQAYTTQDNLFKEDHGIPHQELFPELNITSLQGETFAISDVQKQGSFLIFTATGCEVCEPVYQSISNIQRKFPEMNVFILTLGETEHVKENVQNFNLRTSVFVVNDNMLKEYGITEIFPFSYFISPQGRILHKRVTLNEKHLVELLQTALKQTG